MVFCVLFALFWLELLDMQSTDIHFHPFVHERDGAFLVNENRKVVCNCCDKHKPRFYRVCICCHARFGPGCATDCARTQFLCRDCFNALLACKGLDELPITLIRTFLPPAGACGRHHENAHWRHRWLFTR